MSNWNAMGNDRTPEGYSRAGIVELATEQGALFAHYPEAVSGHPDRRWAVINGVGDRYSLYGVEFYKDSYEAAAAYVTGLGFPLTTKPARLAEQS